MRVSFGHPNASRFGGQGLHLAPARRTVRSRRLVALEELVPDQVLAYVFGLLLSLSLEPRLGFVARSAADAAYCKIAEARGIGQGAYKRLDSREKPTVHSASGPITPDHLCLELPAGTKEDHAPMAKKRGNTHGYP
jgi:hypothetical protein